MSYGETVVFLHTHLDLVFAKPLIDPVTDLRFAVVKCRVQTVHPPASHHPIVSYLLEKWDVAL